MKLKISHLDEIEQFELIQWLLGELTKTGRFRPSVKVSDVIALQGDVFRGMTESELLYLIGETFESAVRESSIPF